MTVTKTFTPLSVLFSCRVRLDEDERQRLKDAHTAFRRRFAEPTQTPVNRGASLTVTTAVDAPRESYKDFGLSSIVVNDLIASRDSISLQVLNNLQLMLGEEIISRKRLETKFKEYLNYVLTTN
tara:strand:+ start:174 stop:545 length:372 start_codon:yes stop_codon:yes gene_type:complete